VPRPDLIDELARAPEAAALFFDLDGTLAPIVSRPEDSTVPEETRAEIARLGERYGLVAIVTGRAGPVARAILGLDTVVAGEHGLELEEEAERWRAPLAELVATVSWPHGDLETKGLTASLHYRNAEDEERALEDAEVVAARARERGFRTRYGRKVLELLPPVDASKGTAVRELLRRHGLRRALYAGDDTTDLDGFAALEGLELAVRVAVASPEGPPELRAGADVVVDDPAALVPLLHRNPYTALSQR